MNFEKILSFFYKKSSKGKNQDINIQVKQLAELFVKEHEATYPELNFSLESLSFIDQIFKTSSANKKEYIENEYCYECEKIASYLLQTLKENFDGDILWVDDKQPIFLFDNYIEFASYKYVKERLTNDNVVDTAKFLRKLSQKKMYT